MELLEKKGLLAPMLAMQGSVLNHVMLHQTVIGEEALLQMEKIGEVPDILVSQAAPGWVLGFSGVGLRVGLSACALGNTGRVGRRRRAPLACFAGLVFP
jgi:hypothetical protein